MSYSFYVETGTPPDLQELAASPRLPDLAFVEQAEIAHGLRPDFYFHAYQPGLSTRGVELGFEAGVLQARVMTCASHDEYELALRLCELAGKRARVATIRSEEGETFAPGERGSYGAEWVEWMVDSGVQFLLAAGEDRGVLHLDGPVRAFAFGPRSLRACLAVFCDRKLLIPFDAGPDLLGSHWHWFDDDHAEVANVPEQEWARVIERAESLET